MTDSVRVPRARRLPQAARREQLLDVAERLFVERGYADVTMEDLARAAGVSRPVPYNHFATKEGVFIACVKRARDLYQDDVVKAIAGVESPIDQLRAGAVAFFTMLEEAPGRWLLLFGSSSVLPGEYSEELAALRFQTIGTITALFLEVAGPGAPPRRLEACAHALSGVGERLGHWRLADPSVTHDELVDHYLSFALDGLRPYLPPAAPAPGSPAGPG